MLWHDSESCLFFLGGGQYCSSSFLNMFHQQGQTKEKHLMTQYSFQFEAEDLKSFQWTKRRALEVNFHCSHERQTTATHSPPCSFIPCVQRLIFSIMIRTGKSTSLLTRGKSCLPASWRSELQLFMSEICHNLTGASDVSSQNGGGEEMTHPYPKVMSFLWVAVLMFSDQSWQVVTGIEWSSVVCVTNEEFQKSTKNKWIEFQELKRGMKNESHCFN